MPPPAVEYDHGYLYLPATAPPRGPRPCPPGGRWWIDLNLELGWLPTPTLPRDLRLLVPDGDSVPFLGLYLPTAGRDVAAFQAGFSLSGGFWFDHLQRYGVDAGLFLLGGNATIFPGYAQEMLVLFPDGVRGGAPQLLIFPPGTPIQDVFPLTYSSRYIAAEVNYRHHLLRGEHVRLDLLLGYRHAFLQDELYFGEPPDGDWDDRRRNRLSASNPFHGGQIGLSGEYRAGPWFVGGAATIALGAVDSKIDATGLFTYTYANLPPGWRRLRHLPRSETQRFAVMPTLRLMVGRQLGDHLRLYAGYTFHYLSRVVRLAEAFDPAAPPRTSDFWIQSISLGMEWRF